MTADAKHAGLSFVHRMNSFNQLLEKNAQIAILLDKSNVSSLSSRALEEQAEQVRLEERLKQLQSEERKVRLLHQQQAVTVQELKKQLLEEQVRQNELKSQSDAISHEIQQQTQECSAMAVVFDAFIAAQQLSSTPLPSPSPPAATSADPPPSPSSEPALPDSSPSLSAAGGATDRRSPDVAAPAIPLVNDLPTDSIVAEPDLYADVENSVNSSGGWMTVKGKRTNIKQLACILFEQGRSPTKEEVVRALDMMSDDLAPSPVLTSARGQNGTVSVASTACRGDGGDKQLQPVDGQREPLGSRSADEVSGVQPTAERREHEGSEGDSKMRNGQDKGARAGEVQAVEESQLQPLSTPQPARQPRTKRTRPTVSTQPVPRVARQRRASPGLAPRGVG